MILLFARLLRWVTFRGHGRIARRLPVPQTGEMVVRFPHGLRLALDLRDPAQRDYLVGMHDRYELALVRRLLRGGGDFVDVGAHIGIYSTTASLAQRGGRGRVLAFEPHPGSRARLRANLLLNGCDNVTVVEAAASSSEGTATLYAPAGGEASWSSVEREKLAHAEAIEVAQTTVDTEVERSGLAPRLVKIDVEGHELEVLAGLERVLKLRPWIIAEVSGATGPELVRRLGALGYDVRRIMRRSLVDYVPVPGIVNVLAVPADARGDR